MNTNKPNIFTTPNPAQTSDDNNYTLKTPQHKQSNVVYELEYSEDCSELYIGVYLHVTAKRHFCDVEM